MTEPVLMIDGTTSDVPAIIRQFGTGTPVAGYVTGPGVEWSEMQFAQFTRKIRIAQSPAPFLDEDSPARVLDVERYAATASDWPDFWRSRTDKARATCYCSLAAVQSVVDACKLFKVDKPSRWWLAWYWGQPGYPSAERVLQELELYTPFPMTEAELWAVQYRTFPSWDESAVYGVPDFSRR